MPVDAPRGNGDVVHTRELFEMERRLKAHTDMCFDKLDEKYVLRAACRERHKDDDALSKKVDGLMWRAALGAGGVASIPLILGILIYLSAPPL